MCSGSEERGFKFDEELERERRMGETVPVYHIGRGGLGNVVGEGRRGSSKGSSGGSSLGSERGRGDASVNSGGRRERENGKGSLEWVRRLGRKT